MIVYAIMFCLIITSRVLFRKNKNFIVVTGFLLWLLLALRSVDMGLYDTKAVYYRNYKLLLDMSFGQIIEYRWMSDKCFYFVMKITSIILENYQLTIAVLAIPYVYGTIKFIEKKSLNPFLSVIVYISLYYMYATFLLRQVIAMGILLFSIDQIEKKNIKKFILIVLIAWLFHKTAIVFLIAYPFALYNKFSFKNYVYILIFVVLSKFCNTIILSIVKNVDSISFSIENNLYSLDNQVSMFGLFITICILLFGHFYRNKAIKSKKYNEDWDIYLNISTLGSMMYACSSTVAEFYRMALYFSLINIIIISNFITKEDDDKIRIIEMFIFVLIFISYFFTRTINNINANPYLFFWS